MIKPKSAILLTGEPRVGKTTLIVKLVQYLSSSAGGFYSQETRRDGARTGFEIITLDGVRSPLASTESSANFPRAVTFNRYMINIDAIELVAVPAMVKALHANKTIIIDEIGPMEILSEMFCDFTSRLFDNDRAVILGTIVKRPYKFADEIKAHPRAKIIEVTERNRDDLFEQLSQKLLPN